jgi:hypothetical protein
MTKLLNLDELVNEQRVLKLNGQEHVMKSLSVGDFIELNREIEKFKKRGGELTTEEQVELMIAEVQRYFPTMGTSELRNLTINQLLLILNFVRDSQDQQSEGDEKKVATD